ncbi:MULTISPECIES: bifunctional glutamate N-acetyltransferase/amino-acid acetyltransferase ArgJ [unclassified Oleiphilus]|jgi:glutamate N-acetyltransferase/amino-acid N-acetyltransferase|uniref:bifunctional glutamate N-acetyltransferase/amino-acid acetyltransferase ArgJ n=4 Tax=Oleiphilus TaxID=141450 RepID=UPI0007C3B00B|nr:MULTISPECIES: bifunctional glutamate N-acetyltransferase/amino-acid acetyltransferase ArgJ [unclassified Oleiphilus]KZY48028.1 bifunctional ornithine acetyltransferase/N-acetylglutamate synthase [Oleiphilus sp. HI0050]KZY75489.1 bifunctional ornithine acetyltransferase/N-acetylglutamate synthase [Oleiphilus sp. HI0069]KZY75594.1 bifunctional ornithine acetyltransferase/N-acetylglutamate synthase [Oleiphilus sp. HI0068]KZY95979.1 bifunctional ornithine acetyltransferase/N-acetylglutamate synt
MAVGKGDLPAFFDIDGARIGVVEAGIKTEGRKDLVLIELAQGSTCSGVFTKNAFCAAPVQLCKAHLATGSFAQASNAYLVVNTGNANAGTGKQGMDDALQSCAAIAEQFGVAREQVLPFSTGVIGEKLPIEKIVAAIPQAKVQLKGDAWADAAEGIMTTDTRPKGVSTEISYAGETVRINGISKGAGMIKPNMATMLAYVGCDASVPQALLDELLQELAEASFNRITVDGDTSTNDSCILFTTGKSKAPLIDKSHADFPALKDALSDVLVELAQLIVRDGEGATKFVTVQVEQAKSTEEALEVAYTIAHSPLIKTALFACDPNWGRILAALGRASIEAFDLSLVEIYLGDVRIVHQGEKCAEYTEERGQAVMDQEEITIRIDLARGSVEETVWTTDLSHDYVTINAEYRT